MKKTPIIRVDGSTESKVKIDMTESIKIPSNLKKKANNTLDKILKKTYFRKIPIDDIFDVLENLGLIPIQEDGTRWSGLLLGRKGDAKIDLAYKGKSVINSVLFLTWYTMPITGKYEVIAYVT